MKHKQLILDKTTVVIHADNATDFNIQRLIKNTMKDQVDA